LGRILSASAFAAGVPTDKGLNTGLDGELKDEEVVDAGA
jgi:hypothetical protein